MSSVGDPRVEAVADALGGPMGWTTWRADALRIAAVAVAALDAYDLDRETPEGGRKAAAVARAVLAERERIAQEIEACLPTPCRDLGRGCACSLCYETHAYRDAARIARGQK